MSRAGLSITVEKLVHGGQAMAVLPDGRKVFLWGALPGETVSVSVKSEKKDYATAELLNVLTPSPERIEPREPEVYLATSPWQILGFEAEATNKSAIITETFMQQGIRLPPIPFISPTQPSDFYGYRNKMEYSFYGDEAGLHLALHNRASRQKIIVAGSALAMPPIDAAANAVVALLNQKSIRASQLKSLILRCSQRGDTVGCLFVKDRAVHLEELPEGMRGLEIMYSNPKSPASVATESMAILGRTDISDTLLGVELHYGALSFFQGNVGMFSRTLEHIRGHASQAAETVDFYAGVGAIGLCSGAANLKLVESEPGNITFARQNAAGKAQVIEAAAEKSLAYITSGSTVIVDPPRAGLHKRVIEQVLEAMPPLVIYLSCNPVTQARDIALLAGNYQLESLQGYNYFPRTPHIETLAVLRRK